MAANGMMDAEIVNVMESIYQTLKPGIRSMSAEFSEEEIEVSDIGEQRNIF